MPKSNIYFQLFKISLTKILLHVMNALPSQTITAAYSDLQISLGNLYRDFMAGERSDNQKQALEAYRNALQGFEAINDTQGVTECQVNLGNLYQELITGDRSDNQKQALEAYRNALQGFEAINDTQELAACQMNLGV
ncbi:MAG: hypothetical protein AB7I41_11225, partial [Candidatus Sericytochromatia bacterium]